MKINRKIIFTIATILIVSNIPIVSAFYKLMLDERHYKYSNFNGTSTSYEFMSRDFQMMKRLHKTCSSLHPERKDKRLYRVFNKNPFAFWRWRLYFFDERYKLPYKNWNEIEKMRGNVKETQGCPLEF